MQRTMAMIMLVLAAMLAACGGDDGSATDGGGEPVTTAPIGVTDTTGATDTTRTGGDLTLPPVGADETFDVRVVNLFGGTDGQGVSLDVYAQDPDDLNALRKVIGNLAYGAVSDPVAVPAVMDEATLWLYPAGAPAPKDRRDADGAIGRATADAPQGGEDAFVVIYEDVIGGKAAVQYQTQDQLRSTTPNEPGKSSFLIASISFNGVIDQAWTAVLDGTCLKPDDVYNDTVVPVDVGSHRLEIRDLSGSGCEAAPAALAPVTFETTAGTRTILVLTGEDQATASLVSFAVAVG